MEAASQWREGGVPPAAGSREEGPHLIASGYKINI